MGQSSLIDPPRAAVRALRQRGTVSILISTETTTETAPRAATAARAKPSTITCLTRHRRDSAPKTTPERAALCCYLKSSAC